MLTLTSTTTNTCCPTAELNLCSFNGLYQHLSVFIIEVSVQMQHHVAQKQVLTSACFSPSINRYKQKSRWLHTNCKLFLPSDYHTKHIQYVQGTYRHVRDVILGELLVTGGWLDWMILQTFSNLGNSVILRLYNHGQFRSKSNDINMITW